MMVLYAMHTAAAAREHQRSRTIDVLLGTTDDTRGAWSVSLLPV